MHKVNFVLPQGNRGRNAKYYFKVPHCVGYKTENLFKGDIWRKQKI